MSYLRALATLRYAACDEQSISGKIGMSPEMIKEIQDRQNKLYAELSLENREILQPILRGTQPWPQPGSHP